MFEAWRSCVEELQGKLETKSGAALQPTPRADAPERSRVKRLSYVELNPRFYATVQRSNQNSTE